ncbi:hypothetical protein HNR62_003143 [Oceanisphaera litoralis]|nr:hypothetical protein [Oceanisphaera litoralis]
MTHEMKGLPNLDVEQLPALDQEALRTSGPEHAPRILLSYGSLRQRSDRYSERVESAAQLSARVNQRSI